jgi:hypothetical protein
MVEKQTAKNNWLVAWFTNLRNTKKNIKKVSASPYARLTLALKARKIIIGILTPWLIYMTYSMVVGIHASGVAGTFQRVIMIGMMAYIIWKIYSTIPQAKKQLEYYKKYPHTINYVPTNVKEDVDSILAKIKTNAEAEAKLKDKPVEADQTNVQEKTTSSSK